ncbi:MAG: ABC transporter permease [Gemmatimonadota bacterium]
MEWRNVWRSLFPKRLIRTDVRDEIAFHIEGRIRELIDRGWDEDAARRHVLDRFGDIAQVEDECVDYTTQRVDGDSWREMMERWWRDLRLAVRGLAKIPAFTGVVVVTLALGIGATTAVFSVLEGVVLRPLPFPEPDELAVVWQNDRATGTVRENASTSDYYDYLDRNRTFESMAIQSLGTAVLARDDALPLQLNAASVSRNLLNVLGLELQLGRNFSEAEDAPNGPRAVLLTDRVWNELFGSDPSIVGSIVTIDDASHEVVGVLPVGIDYPAGETDVWLPIQQDPTIANRPQHWVRVVGRLGPGSSIAAAQEDMTRIMADLELEYPNDNTNRGAFVEPLADVGRGDLSSTLWILFGAVLAVLAIAFVNVANLLLARGARRGRELAVMTAIGAGHNDVLRRFFAEGLVVTVLSAAAGVTLAGVGISVLAAIAPPDVAILGRPEINVPVLGFALAVSVVVCLGFALLPSVQMRRIDLQRELKDGRTTSGSSAGMRTRRFLVAAQLSMAVVLLLGATLLIETVQNLRAIDPGFQADNSLRVDFALPDSRWPERSTYPNWPTIFTFLESLEDEVRGIPGVRTSAVLLNHPLDRGFTNSFRIEGQPYDPSQGEMTTRLVSPAYFETVGLRLVDGRYLDMTDRVDTPGAILLNRVAAERYFPEGDALGQRVAFWGPGFREVVGIVENERIHGLTDDVPPAMYVSMFQSPPMPAKMTLMVRTEVPPLDLVEGVRDAMGRVDAGVPIFNVSTMDATIDDVIARERFASTLLTIFAAVAVFLAVLGVHGVLAYLVAQRGHEVGVRMALGATRHDVVRLIVRQGVLMTILGVVGGLAAAVALSGVLRSLLFGVSATSPTAYALVGVMLGSIALLATAVPAFRAASIDPVSSLRSE